MSGARPSSRIVNALTVDVEEYYHATVFQEAVGGAVGPFESRVEPSTERALRLLAAYDVKATFFVLGEVASEHRSLVRRIARDGHEIACHGWDHALVSAQSPGHFRAGIRRAKALLEDIAGAPVLGYRAASFSIGRHTWAYDVLIEEGFRYDSSVYPILHDRYGQPSAPRFPYEIWRRGTAFLMEFPIGTARVCGMNLPIGGGGYFRLSPFELIRRGIRHVNLHDRQPVMFYFHPWELDPDQPRPPMA